MKGDSSQGTLQDTWVKPKLGLYETEAVHRLGYTPRTIPIDYYDNDDGYWDDWIEKKMRKWNNELPTRRPFFKH